MKKILSVALSTAMAFSMFASVAFGETATTPQAKFDALAAKGVLNGYPDGQAHLEKDLTRAEFAKIVTKLFDLKEVTGKLSYKDKGYTAKNWAVPYIEAVTAANLMQGKDTVKGIFDYNGKVTVEEVAAVLFRALKLETPATTDNSASAWAKGYAQAVINAGLVAKSTNFKANATRSLVVETAYAVENLNQAPAIKTVEVLDATTLSVTFVDGKTAEIKLTTALVADKATEVSFTYNGYSYKYTVTLTAPQVKSATVLNAKQIQVVFNRTVDETSAKTVTKYTYQTNTMAKAEAIPAKSDIELSADKRSVVITTPDALNTSFSITAGTPFKFTVSGVKDTAAATVADYTATLISSDSVAPVLTAASATAKTTTNTVILTFSEPVKTTGAIVYVGGVSATVSADTNTTLKLTTQQSLEAGKTYDISALNIKDFADNFLNPNPTAIKVTVSSDVVAPVVKTVATVSDNKIKVTFDKAIDVDTVAGNFRLLDANGALQGGGVPTLSSDKKVLTLSYGSTLSYTNGTFNGSLILADGIKDVLGNVKATSSHPISLTKDTVAPVLQSASFSTTAISTGAVVVQFSEEITLPVGTSVSSFSLINGNGVIVSSPSISGLGINPDDSTQLFVKTSAPLTSGTYTIRVNSGVVTDTSSASNLNGAAVLTFTVGAASDTTKPLAPVLAAKSSDPAASNTTGSKIYVNFEDTIGMDLASVTDTNNYLLNGKALPAGSYVTVVVTSGSESAAKVVEATVNLPAQSVTSDASDYTLNVTNVKDKAGNAAPAVALGAITLRDDVSPTLTTATISSNGLLVLGFSEKVTSATDATYSDFSLTINGSSTAITGAQFKNILFKDITDGTGTDAGKYVVTLKQTVAGGKVFLDLNADGIYESGSDILIASSTTLSAGVSEFDINKLSGLVVKTINNTNVKDRNALANPLTKGTSITVK